MTSGSGSALSFADLLAAAVTEPGIRRRYRQFHKYSSVISSSPGRSVSHEVSRLGHWRPFSDGESSAAM